MPVRILAGHLKICDGQILWADEDAHKLLGYQLGALAELPFQDLLARPSGTPADPLEVSAGEVRVPARGAIDVQGVTLLDQDGRSVRVDMRAERMDDGCTLWAFSLAARGVRGERLGLLSRHDVLTRLPNRLPSLR